MPNQTNFKRAEFADRLRMPPLLCGDTPYSPRRIPDPTRAADLPLVSIITVVRNAVETVAATVSSVAAQTYTGRIEYIVVDGGSTDGTLDVLAQHEGMIDCLISEPDNGIYDAMNKGLRLAQGRYVTLLNADDRLLPDFIKESVKILEQTGADVSYCDCLTETGILPSGNADTALLFHHKGIRHNSFLHRSTCFERIGGFDTDFKIVADAKWTRAGLLSGFRFVRLEEPLVFFSMAGVSNSSSPDQRRRMIAEQVRLSLQAFELIDEAEAEAIYLSRFNPAPAHTICRLHERLIRTCPIAAEALAGAARWDLMHGPSHRLTDNPDQIDQIITLAEFFGVEFDRLRRTDGPIAKSVAGVLATLKAIETARGSDDRRVCLHFTKVFSTETETFIHDLLGDLAADEPDVLHVMLCDKRINADIRPWPHVLVLPWDDMAPALRRRLYDLIWDRVAPTEVIAHFALNGWTLHQRLTPAQRTLPWLNMCHGIDVFTISEKADYGVWMRDYCALSPRVGFTAVSGFLREQLIAQGVPADKITLVPNAISPSFLAQVKSDDFWRQGRPLRILSIGRLIGWKGQGILLHALARARDMRPAIQLHVTFVYGREARELAYLQDLSSDLGLEGLVKFVPFVDVRADPGLLSAFDMFVLPSTISGDAVPRTETFGVAILEAMAAGLPVIGTDAGGIPEVVGHQDAQTQIVPHGQPEPLAEAIVAMLDAPEQVFIPAHARAEERTRRFAPKVRLRALTEARKGIREPRKRIVHFCALSRGGAAGASLNIHRGLLRRGYDSIFVTRASDDVVTIEGLPGVMTLAPDASTGFEYLQGPERPGFTIFSVDEESISDAALRKVVEGADLINLTWTARFLSAGNIAMLSRLGIPIVITLRDMHMITGGCHYFHGCDRWQSGCADCPQSSVDPSLRYPELTFKARQTAWNHAAITFVALSDHSMDVLVRSPLTSPDRCVKLPNYVDTSAFYVDPTPMEGMEDIPAGLRIGYLPSFGSRVKGHAELVAAMRRLYAKRPDLQLVLVMVGAAPSVAESLPFPVHRVPQLEGHNALRSFYNAVDIVAVPSLEETFSNTCLEALACGTPVAGFATGVLGEVLKDGSLGACAEVGSIDGLSMAIESLAERHFDRDAVAGGVTKDFGMEARMEAYESAFLKIMNEPPGPVPLELDELSVLHELSARRAVVYGAKAISMKPARIMQEPFPARNIVVQILRRPSLLLGPLAPKWRRVRARLRNSSHSTT